MVGNPRHDAVARALDRLAPRIPHHERQEVIGHALSSPGLKTTAPARAAWLSLAAYVRHVHTDYDAMLSEGYDTTSARHFCKRAIETVLAEWGCLAKLDGTKD